MDNLDKTDAQGHIIWAYLKGLPSFSIVERDDGFINVDQGASQYFSQYKNWREHEKQAIKYAKGRCLDLGCGAGRVVLYLQNRGLYALGIDYSPLAIKVCKLRGAKHVKVMDIKDVGKLKKSTFDTITMFGNNFGLFGSMKKAKSLLKKLHKITSKDAVIIAETREPYITNEPTHLKYHAFNRTRGRMSGQLRIRVRFMQYKTQWYDYLFASKKEVNTILDGTGWKAIKFINDPKYRNNGEYITIIKKLTK